MNLNPFLTVFAVLMAAETSLGKEAPAENGKRAIIDFSVVRSIDAVFVGRDELFRSAPTPEMIEHDYEYKVSIKDAQRWNKYPELCRQLATIRYTAYGSKAELRYAIIGYAKDGT